jgi:hypothetical protein
MDALYPPDGASVRAWPNNNYIHSGLMALSRWFAGIP